MLPPCALKSYPSRSMFHKTLLGVPDTFSSFCSSPLRTTPTSRPLTGIRRPPLCHFAGREQSGHLAEPLPHTGYEPKSCIDVSSEHTPTNYTWRRNSFNSEKDLTTTAAASGNSDGFHQQAAAIGSSQHVPASEVNPWLSADMLARTRKPVRGNVSNVSVEETLSKGKRDRDLESVQTLSERHILQVYLEQKAEMAVRGECAAQRRLSEAEADMDIINWEQGNSDMALFMKPIENSNLKDWSCTRRISGQIRLKREKMNLS